MAQSGYIPLGGWSCRPPIQKAKLCRAFGVAVRRSTHFQGLADLGRKAIDKFGKRGALGRDLGLGGVSRSPENLAGMTPGKTLARGDPQEVAGSAAR